MVLNRNYALRSPSSIYDVGFVKGVPVEVHKTLVNAAIAIGAEMADGSKYDPLPPDKVADSVPEGDDRKKQILATIEKMVLRNERNDFNGSGVPDLRRMQPLLGFDITREERDAAWKEYLAGKDVE
jgi:hypothetical protein